MIRTNYNIRLANVDDIPKLSLVEHTASQQLREYNIGEVDLNRVCDPIDLLKAQQMNLVWVVDDDKGTVVGFIYLRYINEQPHIEEIDVLPIHSRKGLGTALANTAIDWAKQEKYKYLSLSTFTIVPWNMPFYEKLGFKVVKSEDLSPEFSKLKEIESSLGLNMKNRVIMLLDL